MTLILIGPHGVGKTTLGTVLARRLGVAFHDEIGRALAVSTRPAEVLPGDPQPDFDARVLQAELDRDAAWHAGDRVVETWHPGNLAWAEARGFPGLAAWCGSLRLPRAIVQPLVAAPAVLHRRRTEPADLDLLLRVGRRASVWAESLGLPLLPPLATDDAHPDALAERIATTLESLR